MNRESRGEIRNGIRSIKGTAAWVRGMRVLEAAHFKRMPAFMKAAKAAEFEETVDTLNEAARKLDEAAALLRSIVTRQTETQQQIAVGVAGLETYRDALAELAKR